MAESDPKPTRRPSTKNNRKPGVVKVPDPEFVCEFCKTALTTEARLMLHVCEPKKRFLRRDDKNVKMGFIAYQQFVKKTSRTKRAVTYEAFAQNTLYLAFISFGRYLMDIKALNPRSFIDFLIRVEAPLSRWQHPTLYETYVREMSKTEDPIDALERQILLMHQWSLESGDNWTEFFRKISPSLAITWIQSGRLSPWVLFTADTAIALMERLSVEQEHILQSAIDTDFWKIKLQRHADSVIHIRTVLQAAGI